MSPSETVLLVLRLTACAMLAVINGIDLSFNVYAVTLKETFNFTQTQVEITASMSCIGFGLSVFEVAVTSLFGVAATFLVTWISLPLSAGLFALAATHREVFHYWPVLVYLVQLYVSTSNAMTFMLVTRVCLQLIPANYTATYIGTISAIICFGKIFLAGLFSFFFPNDLKGFFVCFAIISAVVLSFCYLLLYPKTVVTYEVKPSDENKETKQDGRVEAMSRIEKMFKSGFFHMMLWPSSVFSAAGYTALNNITTVTDSLGMTDPFQIVTVISVCIMATRVVYGLVFDKMGSMSWGFGLLFSTYITFAAGLAIALCFLNTTSIYFVTLLFGFSIGPSFTLPQGLLLAHYGSSLFSPISACLYFSVASSELLLQMLTGYLYDIKTYQLGRTDNTCYGTGCFYWSFVAMLAVTVVCGIIQVINFMKTNCQAGKAIDD